MLNSPGKLQDVLPSGEVKYCINRNSLTNTVDYTGTKTLQPPGILWRSCSVEEMQLACNKQQVSPVYRNLKQYWQSLEHDRLYCRDYPDEMKDLTTEQMNILLPLPVDKRLAFCLSDSMKTAEACQIGDRVIAVDPSVQGDMVSADGFRFTVRFKGALSPTSTGTYFGLLSEDPVDGSPLQISTVELPVDVTVCSLLRLDHLEENAQRAIVCTANWLTSEFEPQPGKRDVQMHDTYHEFDRVVVHLDATNWRRGVIKWLGRLRHTDMAGVEFDCTIEGASCFFDGRKLFDGKDDCCRLVPVRQLQREADFDARLSDRPGCQPPRPPLDFDQRRDEASAMLESRGLKIGSEVYVIHLDAHGRIMWVGLVPNQQEVVVGFDSNESSCSPGNGVLDPQEVLATYPDAPRDILYTFLSLVQTVPDRSAAGQGPEQLNHQHSMAGAFGDQSCDTIMGLVPPMSGALAWQDLPGRNHGVQGHHNSGYLDSTLFAMFATVDAFDGVLERPADAKDIEHYDEIQRCLRERIVNCLRQHKFVRGDHVLKLRQHLDKLNVIPGMMSEEKDPEEFINLLLDHALHHNPFIKLSTGQSCHVLQLFLDPANLPFESGSTHTKGDEGHVADTETLLHLSLIQSNVQFKEPPKCLILQMPRSGKSYKLFHRILPVLELNITNLLPDTARACAVCGKLATLECHQCFLKHDSGRDYTYCEPCFKRFADHRMVSDAGSHKSVEIQYPDEIRRRYSDDRDVDCETVMSLLAVVCIRTSFYVCFLRASPDKWLFFNSMADWEGVFDDGHNIPEVTQVHGVEEWLDKLRLRHSGQMPGEHATRLLEDCYLCFYGNPRVVQSSLDD